MMGLREHSIALISVIVGLGLTELLGNFNLSLRIGYCLVEASTGFADSAQ